MTARLTALLPAPSTRGKPQPWEEIKADLGVLPPRDFRDFVDTYGYGSLDGLISVVRPRVHGGETGQELRTFHGPVRFPPWPTEGSPLAWGTTQAGYDLLYSRYIDVRTEEELEDAGEDPWEYVDDFWDGRERERAQSEEVTWVRRPGRHRCDNPPVPRLTVQGFGLDGDDLSVSVTLDLEPSTTQLMATVRIGGPNGDVLRSTGLPALLSNGELTLRLAGRTNGTGMSWRELLHAMTHEPEWSLSVSVTDPGIGAARVEQGIVTGIGMHESGVDTVWGTWP
ncbi:hypothetical protein [Streptomyces murinus]|uniref:hypothetical protein n=1 Tax=Streptomyces murinus TaxID=33900 RepID=UPI003806979C